MLNIYRSPLLTALLLLTACVTVNVYFPAAAAESAADKIIKGIYGADKAEPTGEEPVPGPQGRVYQQDENFLVRFLQSIIPAAEAQQADLDISTPGINKLQALMTERHKQLSAYYDSGAVGMDGTGLLSVRDANATPLKDRNLVKKLVLDENRDRNKLYKEIALANGHPEWEADIRRTFARRWVANAPGGWWYQDAAGSWLKK